MLAELSSFLHFGAAHFAWPLSFPLLFAGIWFLSYKLAGKAIPAGSIRIFLIWLVLTVLVVPITVGFTLAVGMAGHPSVPGVYFPLAVAAVVWVSIVPILLYKTVKQARTSQYDA